MGAETFVLCVLLPFKMCQPMSLDACYAKLTEYADRGIHATCEPQRLSPYSPSILAPHPKPPAGPLDHQKR
jgi:hypothetical protein